MTTVTLSIEKAVVAVARKNLSQLKFLRDFEDGKGRHLMSRGENWFQLELAYQLSLTAAKKKHLFVEYGIHYRGNSAQLPAKKKEATSGRVDIAFKPNNATDDLYVGLELKFKKNPTVAIRSALQDLRKFAAANTPDDSFRAIYILAIFEGESQNKENNPYIKFADENGHLFKFGKYFDCALIGFEVQPRNQDTFSKNFKKWVRDLRKKAQGKITFN